MIKTILVPTDFSETAKNATHYAIAFAEKMNINKITLFHGYQVLSVNDPIVRKVEVLNVEPIQSKSIELLEAFKASLGDIPAGIQIELTHGSADLIDGIEEIIEFTQADIIISGITGGNKLKETFVGSNTLALAKKVSIPVIIVPPTATCKQIQKMALATDLVDVEATIPDVKIRKPFILHQLELSIVHVSSSEEMADVNKQKDAFKTLFPGYPLSFVNLQSDNFTEALNDYCEKESIDLLTVIPKQHGIWGKLFNSHTKALAFQSNIPLYVVHN